MSVYTNNTLHKNKPNEAWSKIFNFIDDGQVILDVGCSSGRLGAALKKEKTVNVIGIDIDESDIKIAKSNLDKAFVLNIETDNIDSLGKFDVVIMADVIEHLVDPSSALKKLKKILKPNGKVIFSVPNMANGLVRLELLQGRFKYADWGLLDKTHLHYYDKVELQRVMYNAGLNIKKMDCTLRNMPKKLIRSEVEKVGLEATDKFIKHMNTPEAATFQFIGWAEFSNKKGIKIETSSPHDAIDQEIASIGTTYENIINSQTKDIKNLQSIIEQKDTEINQLNSQLQSILKSKGWLVLEKVNRAKNKITNRK